MPDEISLHTQVTIEIYNSREDCNEVSLKLLNFEEKHLNHAKIYT